MPVTHVAAVAVELEHGRAFAVVPLWPEVFGMHARAADAGEEQVEAFGVRPLEGGRAQFNGGVGRLHLAQARVPEGVQVGRAGVEAGIGVECAQGKVDGGMRPGNTSSFRHVRQREINLSPSAKRENLVASGGVAKW